MLGKLFRLECKSVFRYMSIVWIALLASSVLQGITSRLYYSLFDYSSYSPAVAVFLHILPSMLYGLILTAEIVITLILLIARFYKGMLGDEGYLMNTLPVKMWQLIDAKGAASCVVILISGFAALISVFLMELIGSGYNIFSQFSMDFESGQEAVKTIIFFVYMIIIGIAALLVQIYRVYASLSIGQLAGKYRLLCSGAAYIGINAVISVITGILIVIANITGFDVAVTTESSYASLIICMSVVMIIVLVELAVFHIITERILSRKLNLL